MAIENSLYYICYKPDPSMTEEKLRENIIFSLNNQGFSVNGHVEPSVFSKDSFRNLHQHSRAEQFLLQKKFISSSFDTVEKYLLNGREIIPENIDLELREVIPGSIEHVLYRWWNLVWWSIPYQRAYGRQMRFIIWDKGHNAPFGLIGLQSPVLKMAVRDKHLKIPKDELDIWINKSMQAKRLGELPPYNQLLGGKMVALALTSNEIREVYKKKYTGIETRLEKRILDSELLFITTTSAFGKSSIYNRLKFKDQVVAQSLGFTKGSGTFHINEQIYFDIKIYLNGKGINTNTSFGSGPSRKIMLLDTAFSLLKLPEYQYHNIQREYFIFPLVKNLQTVISNKVEPEYLTHSLMELSEYWKKRWCLPRSKRFNDWSNFDAKQFIDECQLKFHE